MSKVRRLVNLRASAAQIRTAMYGSEERMIVPVIIMKGNAVVRPLYSKGPEFVPVEELSKSYITMNGRPVVPDHPLQGLSSANEPSIKASESFGDVFNCKIVNGDMHGEMWLSRSAATSIGDSAEFAISTLEAGEMIEISCGVYVVLKEEKGVSPSGVAYEYRWTDLDFDHLAAGLNGSEGACSIELGCGAPRLNAQHDDKLNNDNSNGPGNRQLRSTKGGDNVKSLAKRLRSLLTGQTNNDNDSEPIAVRQLFVPSAEGLGNKELNSKLSTALFNTVPAYGWLWDSYPADSTVIYVTYDAGDTFNSQYWMRSYSVDADENVTLGDDEQEMVFDESAAFTPKAATTVTANNHQPTAACGCHNSNPKGAVTSMDKTAKSALVARLLANEKVKARNLTQAALEAMSDEVLEAMGDLDGAGATVPTTAPVPTPAPTPAPVPVAITEEQLPQSLRDELAESRAIIAERKSAQAARHATLVANLKELVKTVHTEEQLKAMSVDQLESIDKLLKVNRPTADYSGQGFPTGNTTDANRPDAPPDMAAAIRAARGQSVPVTN